MLIKAKRVKTSMGAGLATLFLGFILLCLHLFPVGPSDLGLAQATTYVPEGPVAEDQVADWVVTRANGRRTVTLGWISPNESAQQPELTNIELAWGRENKDGKFPLVITIAFRSYGFSPPRIAAYSAMRKRIKLSRPLSEVILLDGGTAPPAKELVPKRPSKLYLY